MSNTVALIVDFQKDFVLPSGRLHVGGAENLISLMTDYLDHKIEDLAGVLFTFDSHYEETYFQSSEHTVSGFPIHCVYGTDGHKLALESFAKFLIDDDYTNVMTLHKGVFDMWEEPNPVVQSIDPLYQTFLTRDSLFQYVKEKDMTVEVSGVASDYCVRSAIRGLVERGIKIRVMAELTQGIAMTIEEVIEQEGWTQVEIIR